MKISNFLRYTAVFALIIAPMFVLAPAVSALPDTCTWTGGDVANDNFNDADNWTGCDNGNIPENGDAIAFDNTGATGIVNAMNNMGAMTFSSVQFTGAGAQTFAILANTGADTLTITNDIAQDASAEATIVAPVIFPLAIGINVNAAPLAMTGTVSGAGNIAKNGVGKLRLGATNTFTGTFTASAGEVEVTNTAGLGSVAAGTTVANGATLEWALAGDSLAVAEPLTLNGSGLTLRRTLEFTKAGGSPSEITLSGTVSLSGANIDIGSDRPLVVSGVISGANGLTYASMTDTGSLKLTGANNYTGTTVVAGTVIVPGNQGSSSYSVNTGGTLKGTGTVGALTVSAGGHVAPGLSPGCLVTGNTTILGNYDVELGGITACTEYDQLQVTGTVDVTGGTLNVSRFGGFTPAVGQTFTVISNDAADAITGTFTGLAQGATITVDGYTFTISYTGGDGNDVVLTVTGLPAIPATPPAAPNTGFGLIMANPLLTLLLTSGSAAALLVAARRYGYATIPTRK